MVLLALLVCVLTTVLIIKQFAESKKNYPPGPPSFPIFGSMPFLQKSLGDKSGDMLTRNIFLQREYGNICMFYLGPKPSVLVSDFASIKKVFNDDVAANRPINK